MEIWILSHYNTFPPDWMKINTVGLLNIFISSEKLRDLVGLDDYGVTHPQIIAFHPMFFGFPSQISLSGTIYDARKPILLGQMLRLGVASFFTTGTGLYCFLLPWYLRFFLLLLCWYSIDFGSSRLVYGWWYMQIF